jgi:hypothetical protein
MIFQMTLASFDKERVDCKQFGDATDAINRIAVDFFGADLGSCQQISSVVSFNSFEITPNLLSSNTINGFKGSLQIDTPHLCTYKETGTTGSQNIPGGHQQHGQGDSSEIPRQLYLKLREMEYSHLPPMANQQTPTSIKFSPLLSPTNVLSTVKVLEEVPIIDGSGTPKQCKNVLHARKINRTSPKDRRRSRKVRVQTKGEMVAKRERYLLRNRQAAHICREKNKTWISELLKREEFFIRNNAKLPYEIEQTMLELGGLRAIAVEHYRVCPIPSPELAACFEEEVVCLQHSKLSALTHHSNQSLTPPPQDANYTS